MTLLSDDRPARLCRAKPMLGTLVEVRADGPSRQRLHVAVERAFAAVRAVDRLMSYHRALSDVSRLNRSARRSAVRVHPWTWRVLTLAVDLARASGGTFDCTVAAPLIRSGYLPRQNARPLACKGEILFRRDRRVRFAARFGIDLGGIAKGFAVDCAIAVLRAGGATAGAVNAGGDLRLFGPGLQPVSVRTGDSSHCARIGWLKDGAIATSSVAATRRRFAGRAVSPIIAPSTARSHCGTETVSVIAPTCAVADGLTKPMLLNARRARAALRRYHARAQFVAPAASNSGGPE